MRISDWSSDVCSSDLAGRHPDDHPGFAQSALFLWRVEADLGADRIQLLQGQAGEGAGVPAAQHLWSEHGMETRHPPIDRESARRCRPWRGSIGGRSEEHTSELQSLMRSSYAVFCLKKKKIKISKKLDIQDK